MDIMLKNILSLIDANYQKDEDFEKEFGIAKTTVSAWRRGKLKSYQKHATNIASFFNVSSDWLSGNGQKNKPSAEVESLSPEAIKLSKRIDQLSPANRAKLDELIDLYLSAQDKKK